MVNRTYIIAGKFLYKAISFGISLPDFHFGDRLAPEKKCKALGDNVFRRAAAQYHKHKSKNRTQKLFLHKTSPRNCLIQIIHNIGEFVKSENTNTIYFSSGKESGKTTLSEIDIFISVTKETAFDNKTADQPFSIISMLFFK